MNRVWILLPVLAACTATPAFAQVSARAELRAGYDEVRAEVTVFDEAFTERFGEGDFFVGAEVGVDAHLADSFLVGAYAGIDFSQVDGCENDLIFDGDRACIDAGRGFTAGLRAGIPMGDGLLYVKGGYSRAKLKGSYHDGDDELFSDSDTATGYHLGAGFELNLSSMLYVKGEYVHHRYGDIFEDSILEPDGVDPTRHQLLAGIGVRFGGRAAAPVAELPPPPPPPPAAPAMQTCPDGSVILATDACPLPPPPPPPPPPPSGERG